MPSIKLDNDAIGLLTNYRWSGNIRQLKNIAEQLSILEEDRNITKDILVNYLPKSKSNLPALVKNSNDEEFNNEREILYKVLFDMKSDLNDLKKLTLDLMNSSNINEFRENNEELIERVYPSNDSNDNKKLNFVEFKDDNKKQNVNFVKEVKAIESLSIHEKELELIKKSLEKHKGKRKFAAEELGISERTLYRKIKQFNL